MPNFNGVNLFGRSVTIMTADNPRTTQKSTFAGINGVDTLDLGRHGRYTEVKGLLTGQNATVLNANIGLIRSYNDGQLYTFVDNFGNLWPFCQLENFEMTSRVMQDDRGFYQSYAARIFHAY
jgi:hypothetical protein